MLALEVGALCEGLLREKLHRDELEVLDAVEGDDRHLGVCEDVVAHLDGALLLDDGLEGRTAAHLFIGLGVGLR